MDLTPAREAGKKLRIATWNVDGLFSILRRRGQALDRMLEQLGAGTDVLLGCTQWSVKGSSRF